MEISKFIVLTLYPLGKRGLFMGKSKPNQQKIDIVKQFEEKLKRANAVFLTDYKGLTHKQLEDLRKNLKQVNAEFQIIKNTLLKKSLEKTDKLKDELSEFLNNETAAFLIYGDELSAVKKLADFAASFSLPKIKIGLLEGKIASSDDFKRLSLIPSKEILLSTLVARLNSPLSGLHYALNWNLQRFVIALNNVKSKKPN